MTDRSVLGSFLCCLPGPPAINRPGKGAQDNRERERERERENRERETHIEEAVEGERYTEEELGKR